MALLAGIGAAGIGMTVGGIVGTIFSLGVGSVVSVPTTLSGIVMLIVKVAAFDIAVIAIN